jgi:hypothetical protein
MFFLSFFPVLPTFLLLWLLPLLIHHLVMPLHVKLASNRELGLKLPFHHTFGVINGFVSLSKVEILEANAFIGLHFSFLAQITS